MRSSGVLMHISSLPSPYGIGTMGEEARKFVDFLVKAGQQFWQVLPICPTSYGDSPYQSFSSFAGNPYFIDLETLCKEGLLTVMECKSYEWGGRLTQVDYEILHQNRFPLLHKAFARFVKTPPRDFAQFCQEQADWLEDYALYMALKDDHDGVAWSEWEPKLQQRDKETMAAAKKRLAEDIQFWEMVQYLFYQQWKSLKQYANDRGIRIIGDVPIYVALDSADVWAEPGQFYIDKNLQPIDVAGCPPDAFSEDGQLWGNPLFRWDVMKKDGYRWWIRRMEKMSKLFDVIRIDHFRGFDSYYAIPFGEKTARKGEWRKGPGIALFRAIEQKLGKLDIIAEDLGFLTESVRKLLADSGYPGMKILQFAFDASGDSDYLPHKYSKNSVVYAGTHDNDTILGWLQEAPEDCVALAKEYLKLDQAEGYHWGIMRGAWSSVSDMAIVTMQDLLGIGSEGRMNVPSVLGGNWMWRMRPDALDDALAEKIRRQVKLYGRLPKEPEEPKQPENGSGKKSEEAKQPENGSGKKSEEPKQPENGNGKKLEEAKQPENGNGKKPVEEKGEKDTPSKSDGRGE